MSKLREAAALLIEHGKAIGRLEQQRALMVAITQQSATADRDGDGPGAQRLIVVAKHMGAELGELETFAAHSQALARDLLAELEHPGAVLARRLLASWHGARAAWRGTR